VRFFHILGQITQLHSCIIRVLVSGKGQFLTPTESMPLNRSPNDLSQVIPSMTSTAVQDLVEIHQWGDSGQNGKNQKFYLYPLFKELTYRSDRSQEFHASWLKLCRLTQVLVILAFIDIAAKLGSQIVPKFPFLGV